MKINTTMILSLLFNSWCVRLKRSLQSRYAFANGRKPNDHSLKRVDNNLISTIARANDSHRVRGVSRQNERNANSLWGGWIGREVTMAVPIVFLTFIPLIIPWDYYDRRWRSSLCLTKADDLKLRGHCQRGAATTPKMRNERAQTANRSARCGDRELT